LHGLPLCLIRGENSDLLTEATWDRMRNLRHDAIAAEVPDRGHVPFLDEPQALHALQSWIDIL
jgi:pimeloyl-ACP methyl ester carboxylesterase